MDLRDNRHGRKQRRSRQLQEKRRIVEEGFGHDRLGTEMVRCSQNSRGQRRLGLRWRAVDLVAQHQMGEHRPRPEVEAPLPLVEHVRADYVGRQQIGRALNASVGGVDRASQGAHERGLANARMVLDHHGGTPHAADLVRHDAGDDVGGAAGRKRIDDRHRPRRIGFRPGDARGERQRGRTRGQIEKCAAQQHTAPSHVAAILRLAAFLRIL